MELIKIETSENGERTVNAKELHAFLEVGKNFSDWIKGRIEKYDFVKNVDYVRIKSTPQNGGVAVGYALSVDMAKELSMVERNEKGREARKYFIKMEKRALQQAEQPAIPSNYAEALQLAADQARQLEEAKPKIESFDKFIDSNGLSNMGQAAKLLGTGRNKLFELLRDEGLLMLSNIPYQKYVDAGYFEVKKKVHNGQNYSVTFVTPKGLNYIRKFF